MFREKKEDARMSEHIRYVFTREGSMPTTIPAEVADGIIHGCGTAEDAERVLDFAGLVTLRLGRDGGTALLRHWHTHDPSLLRDVDPVLADVLARTPELITGPLRA
jgi:hypothetical protein